ncbi:MAG: helix-turn-helix domain-containing protein [Clostridia bacterium]|nr:helix-turn-helix domain-containing protein [Clostridia bacterium]
MRSYEYAMTKTGHGSVPCCMPFYTAKEQNSLRNRKGPFSAVEILRELFNEDFKAALDMYVRAYPDDVKTAIGNKEAQNLRLVRIGEPRVADVYDSDIRHMAIELVIIGTVRADANGRRIDYIRPFNMNYLIDVIGKKCSAPSICAAASASNCGRPRVNGYLLPIMYEDDYPDTAYRMLKTYYPEALDEPTAIDGIELAHRMKLKVKHVRLPKGSDVRGLIYFSRATVTVLDDNDRFKALDVTPLTILLNTDLCPTPEMKNSTVVHECVHAYLDYRFFMLQSLSCEPYKACMGRSLSPRKYVRTNSPVEWMELQAEKLPAYILMEETNTRRYIEDLYDDCRWDRSAENVMRIVEKLAEKFGVSRSMAKYRMIELGFPEAEGVYCYVDGKRIPDYGCSDKWEEGITYSISRMEAAALLNRSDDFNDALHSGCYSYVEGHYCLNSPEYVSDTGRSKRLTEYARTHIDECCISFSAYGRYAKADYSKGIAARKTEVKDKYQTRHNFNSEPDTKERMLQNKQFQEDAMLWDRLKKELPNTFYKAVQFILDAKGISQDELAWRIGISRSAMQKWCKGKVTLTHIIALCIALDVRADIGEELVRIAGLAFRDIAEDRLFHAMLFETKDLSVERANDIMTQNGFARLLSKSGDESIT